MQIGGCHCFQMAQGLLMLNQCHRQCHQSQTRNVSSSGLAWALQTGGLCRHAKGNKYEISARGGGPFFMENITQTGREYLMIMNIVETS